MKYKGKSIEVIGSKMLFGKETLRMKTAYGSIIGLQDLPPSECKTMKLHIRMVI